MENKEEKVQVEEECPMCPEGLVCENSDLICVNIPCIISVVLLGLIRLDIGPLCIRANLVDGEAVLTNDEKLAQLQQVISTLKKGLK